MLEVVAPYEEEKGISGSLILPGGRGDQIGIK